MVKSKFPTSVDAGSQSAYWSPRPKNTSKYHSAFLKRGGVSTLADNNHWKRSKATPQRNELACPKDIVDRILCEHRILKRLLEKHWKAADTSDFDVAFAALTDFSHTAHQDAREWAREKAGLVYQLESTAGDLLNHVDMRQRLINNEDMFAPEQHERMLHLCTEASTMQASSTLLRVFASMDFGDLEVLLFEFKNHAL